MSRSRRRVVFASALSVLAATILGFWPCSEKRGLAEESCERQKHARERLVEAETLASDVVIVKAGLLQDKLAVSSSGDLVTGPAGVWFFGGAEPVLIARNCEKAAAAATPFVPTSIALRALRVLGGGCAADYGQVKGNLRTMAAALEREHQALGAYPTTLPADWKYVGTGYQWTFLLKATSQGFDAFAVGVGNAVNGDVWRLSNGGEPEQVVNACALGSSLPR